MAATPFDLLMIAAFAAVGPWLSRINGKDGLLDELPTPFPCELGGAMFVLFERIAA